MQTQRKDNLIRIDKQSLQAWNWSFKGMAGVGVWIGVVQKAGVSQVKGAFPRCECMFEVVVCFWAAR